MVAKMVAESQLYGIMVIYVCTENGEVWPIARDTQVNQLKNIFGTIDYVINLNELAKFGSGKIFRDWGTVIYPTYKGLGFFQLYRLKYSLNGWIDFDAQYFKRRRLVRRGALSMIE